MLLTDVKVFQFSVQRPCDPAPMRVVVAFSDDLNSGSTVLANLLGDRNLRDWPNYQFYGVISDDTPVFQATYLAELILMSDDNEAKEALRQFHERRVGMFTANYMYASVVTPRLEPQEFAYGQKVQIKPTSTLFTVICYDPHTSIYYGMVDGKSYSDPPMGLEGWPSIALDPNINWLTVPSPT